MIMAAEVGASLSSLADQLRGAKDRLKETEESIKRTIGRDTLPSESRGPRRSDSNIAPRTTALVNRTASFARDNADFLRLGEESLLKRPRAIASFHPVNAAENPIGLSSQEKRRGGWDDDDEYRRRKVQSTVIVDPLPQKTREERISEAQDRVGNADVARNRRIFGSLMGTLKKFQQEQTTRAQTDERQKEIRKKLEEKEAAEQKEAREERKKLFQERSSSAAVVKFLETKIDMINRFNDWEASQKPLLKFLRTEGDNCVYYIPKNLNQMQEEKMARSRQQIENEIQAQRQKLEAQLQEMDRKINYAKGKKGVDRDNSIEELDEGQRPKEEFAEDLGDDLGMDDSAIEGLELEGDVPVDVPSNVAEPAGSLPDSSEPQETTYNDETSLSAGNAAIVNHSQSSMTEVEGEAEMDLS